MPFRTEDGIEVPAVTAEQMREVDRIAVEEFGLDILQMNLFRQNLTRKSWCWFTFVVLLGAASSLLVACTSSPASSVTVVPTHTATLKVATVTPTLAVVATHTQPLPSSTPVSLSPTPTSSQSTSTSTPAPPTATSAHTPSGSIEVNIVEPPSQPPQSWHFDPATVTVKVGTKATWTNSGAVPHTVTADDGKTFDSGDMQANATFSFTPTLAGTFAYHCTYHPWMKGTLIVIP